MGSLEKILKWIQIFWQVLLIKTLTAPLQHQSFCTILKTQMQLQSSRKVIETLKLIIGLSVFFRTYLRFMKDVSINKCQSFFIKFATLPNNYVREMERKYRQRRLFWGTLDWSVKSFWLYFTWFVNCKITRLWRWREVLKIFGQLFKWQKTRSWN